MTNVPSGLTYSESHFWGRAPPSSTNVRIGITDFAQAALGEIVAVVLPDVGQRVTRGDAFGDIESNKVVDDLVAPAAGTVVAVNAAVSEDPTVINADPYREGVAAGDRAIVPGTGRRLGADEYVDVVTRD